MKDKVSWIILLREFRLKQVPMERNSYFSGLGEEIYDHIEDAPKDIVSWYYQYWDSTAHILKYIYRYAKKENSTIISITLMKMPIPVTTATDGTLDFKGAIFHRYHSFKMTMLTCNLTVFNFKTGDSRQSHGTYFHSVY